MSEGGLPADPCFDAAQPLVQGKKRLVTRGVWVEVLQDFQVGGEDETQLGHLEKAEGGPIGV